MPVVSLPFVRLSLVLLLVAGLATLATVSAQSGEGEDSEYSIVCHLPGGNHAKARTTQVDADGLAEHLAHGDAQGDCGPQVLAEQQESVPDGKVLVCHVPDGNPDNAHELVLSEAALDEHLAHGDGEYSDGFGTCEGVGTLGASGPRLAGPADGMKICHKGRTRMLAVEALEEHTLHGDSLGTCPS